MSDNVDSLLTQMQDEIESAKKLGRLRLVDPQVLNDLLESVRAAMPNTVERAKEIVAKRSDILEAARGDAERIVENARQRAADSEASANARVQEVVQSAKERVMQMRAQGEQIVADAQAEAERLVEINEITRNASARADDMLRTARADAESLETETRRNCEQAIGEANDYSRDLQRRTEEWGMQYTGSVRAVVEEIVNEAEEILASSLTDIRSTQKRLQTSMTKTAIPPEFYGVDEPELF